MSLTPLLNPFRTQDEHHLHLREAGAEAGHQKTGGRFGFDLAAVEVVLPRFLPDDQRIRRRGINPIGRPESPQPRLAAVDKRQQLHDPFSVWVEPAFNVGDNPVHTCRLDALNLKFQGVFLFAATHTAITDSHVPLQ